MSEELSYNEFKEEEYPVLKETLKQGLTIEIVCSIDTIQRNKELVKELLTEYPKKITFYVMEKPPKHHATLIGQHLYLEIPHKPDTPSKGGLGITNAKEYLIEDSETTFKKMKSGTVQIIRSAEDIEIF